MNAGMAAIQVRKKISNAERAIIRTRKIVAILTEKQNS